MTKRISLTPYLAELERIPPLRWTGQVTDHAVGLFETERGELDGCVESQLGEIERRLANPLRKQA